MKKLGLERYISPPPPPPPDLQDLFHLQLEVCLWQWCGCRTWQELSKAATAAVVDAEAVGPAVAAVGISAAAAGTGVQVEQT